ncbi:MAG: VWA domain-containing protein, partial [Gammaproteobacteria bacterium]
MSVRRRGFEPISIAFLDVITCGFGAIILLLMIARFGEPPAPEPVDDPRGARIAAQSRELFALRREARELGAGRDARGARLAALQDETTRLVAQAREL